VKLSLDTNVAFEISRNITTLPGQGRGQARGATWSLRTARRRAGAHCVAPTAAADARRPSGRGGGHSEQLQPRAGRASLAGQQRAAAKQRRGARPSMQQADRWHGVT